MENYWIILSIVHGLNVIGFGKLLRLLFFRVAYPRATLKQIESFEKNTRILFPTFKKKVE